MCIDGIKSPNYFVYLVFLYPERLTLACTAQLRPGLLVVLVVVLVVVTVREVHATFEIYVALVRYRQIGPATENRTVLGVTLDGLLWPNQRELLFQVHRNQKA